MSYLHLVLWISLIPAVIGSHGVRVSHGPPEVVLLLCTHVTAAVVAGYGCVGGGGGNTGSVAIR